MNLACDSTCPIFEVDFPQEDPAILATDDDATYAMLLVWLDGDDYNHVNNLSRLVDYKYR